MELAGQHLHFVGIGGCGMSGLARIVRGRGAHCTGSDMTDTDVTRALIADGIPVVALHGTPGSGKTSLIATYS